jgi:tetratricopeptide (TPR) repeat protein
MNYLTFSGTPGQQFNKLIKILVAGFVLILTANSCKKGSEADQFRAIDEKKLIPSGITIDYPAEGTIFPPDFPSPHFQWTGIDNKPGKWHVRFSTGDRKVIYTGIAETSSWKPDSAAWEKVRATAHNEPVFLTIIGEHKGISGGNNPSGRVSFSFSGDPVGASVFYRAVPLPFGYAVRNVHEIEWYRGSIAGGKPHKVLDNIPVCANCHSFSGDGIIAMDIDYANDKGSYIISPLSDTVHMTLDKIITWSDYRREDGANTYGLLSQISPNGRFVLSTVKDRSVFVAIDSLEFSQLFFPIKGIIGVYDRNSRKFSELPGASDKSFVQSNPNWSPDSREVMFTRTKRYISSKIDNSESVLLNQEDVKEFTTKQKEFKFDLYRIPFNDGKGGQAVPVPGASGNGKSNFFARYSPDGKWVVFCKAENFMLLQRDSKLYIMPSAGGTPRLMNCNTKTMNSWHSWSPNSKWLVFSSKSRGAYTQLFLTHIDENGNDSPAVFLENLAFEKRAANIPEFFNDKFPGLNNMSDEFSQNALYYNRLASLSMSQNEFRSALENIGKAIEADSTWYDAYKNRLYVDLVLGRGKSKDDLRDRAVAKDLLARKIAENPGDMSLIVKRGNLRLLTGDFDGALQDGLNALKSNSKDYGACDLIATTYQKKGEPEKSKPYLEKMKELQPDNTQITYKMAGLYQSLNQPGLALDLLNELIAKNPNESRFYLSRAGLSVAKGVNTAAKADYDKAISADPENFEAYRERGSFYRHSSSPDLAKTDYDKAISLLDEKIRKNPQDAPLFVNRAEIMELNGDTRGALTAYENYLKDWPLNYSVLLKQGQIWYSIKQWQKSIDSYSAVIDNFPNDAKIFFSRGLAFQQAGLLPNALTDLDKAIQLAPQEYPYFFFRARIRSQIGDRKGSQNDLRTSESLLKEQKSKRRLDQAEENLLKSIQKMLNE